MIHHALPEETLVTGVSSEEAEMETSPTSAPISATARKDALLPNEVPGTVLPQCAVLPRACPQLVWGLLSSLRKDHNHNTDGDGHSTNNDGHSTECDGHSTDGDGHSTGDSHSTDGDRHCRSGGHSTDSDGHSKMVMVIARQ